MSTEPKDSGPAESNTGVLVWALEAVAGSVGLSLEPVATQRIARAALEGQRTPSAAQRTAALIRALEESRLVPAPADHPVDALDTIELPLVSVGQGGLALVAREGGRIEVARPGQPTVWLSLAEVRELVRADLGPWLTAAPATPLEELAHHPSPWARLKALMHTERDDLWIIVIYAAAVGLFTLATPIAVQALVGSVAFGTLLQPIVVLSLLFLFALGFQATLKALQALVVERLQQRVFVRTALDFAWRLPRVKREALEQGFGPESVNRFFEVMTMQKTASVLLTDGIAALLQIAIGLLVLGFYHPALLAFDLLLVVLLTALVLGPLRRGLSTNIDESYAKYEVAAWLEQLARPGAAFRSKGGAAFAVERADALTRRYLGARRSHFRVLFGQTLGVLALQVSASAALLGLGGWLVVQRELTLGQLVAAEIIVASVTSSVAKLPKLLDAMYDLLTALDKVGHVLDVPVEEADRGEPLPSGQGVAVQAQDVSDGVLPPLSVSVPKGARLALVGAHGHPVGQWLAGLALPAQGTVSLDGVETKRARGPALRDQVAWIGPDDVFDGSALENVTVGRAHVTTQDARQALDAVGLLDELRALPDGLDTRLFHTGWPLTPSQVTRLLVARAIAGKPRLVVMDLPLDGLPKDVRERCVRALTAPSAPWTFVALVSEQSQALALACATHAAAEPRAGGLP